MAEGTRHYMAFKAGRAYRRGDTNFVDPSPTKGAIYLSQEDELVHFRWKNRDTDSFEEDLIMFPGDAEFVKVPSPDGRVYVLKFSSSAERHFFWMQAESPLRDDNFVHNVNRVLEDPEVQLQWSTPGDLQLQSAAGPNPYAPRSRGAHPGTAAAAGIVRPSNPDYPAPSTAPTSEQLAQIRQFAQLFNPRASSSAVPAPDLSLIDVLTPQTLAPVLANPTLSRSLIPFLPPDLPTPANEAALARAISSPQFRAAVASLDRALRTGLLGDLVRGLGLPAEAGLGVEAFLSAIEQQARGGGGTDGGDGDGEGRMDTD